MSRDENELSHHINGVREQYNDAETHIKLWLSITKLCVNAIAD
ncbi:MAG: hypothetical protein SFY66_02935 [Oculatellaceae cyanobacterium bins.114]|nr:hypothetical protein [Oculatellaceae cyanobacterium bins.114]